MLIVKTPGINGLGKTDGCRNAGNGIIEKLGEIKSNEKGKIIDKNLLDFEEIHVDNENLTEQDELIYENAGESLESQDKVIFLGGDHSISYSIGRAFLDFCKNKKESCLIVFDAHPDCMKPLKEPTHEDWLSALIEYGFNPENILLIGIRNKDREEIRFLAEKKIKSIEVEKINFDLEGIGDFITEFSQGKELYVSIDIDVIDPGFVKATGYKEPGGLSVREILYLVKRLSVLKNLKAVDIVEINEKMEGAEETVKIGAKILGEFL